MIEKHLYKKTTITFTNTEPLDGINGLKWKQGLQHVLGLVPATALGRTLTHEHFEIDYSHFYMPPPAKIVPHTGKKISLSNVGLVRQYPYAFKENLGLDESTRASVMKEMQLYSEWGGGSVVENSNHGLKRNTSLMKQVQQATGVNVIAGTGYYLAQIQPQSVLNMSQEDIYNVMMTELTEGCIDDSEVKCGFIGEIASDWPISDFEKRCIVAAAEVQSSLHCAISFHPGRDPEAPFEIIRIYQEAGGDVRKAVMSHLDRTLSQLEQLEFAALGTYCQQDLFGTECSYYQFQPTFHMLSDAQRLENVKALLRDGREEQILMSHDIHTKHRLMDYGGHGYSHILINILHKMLVTGFSQQVIDKITIENPRNWLSNKS